LSRRTTRGGAAPQQRRRPAPARSGFWRWLDYVSIWFGVVVLALSFAVLAFPTAYAARRVLSGGGTDAGELLQLLNFVAAEVVIVLMCVLAAYAAAPQHVRLAPRTVRLLGTLSFGGMFFLILLVLQSQLYAAVPVLVYFLSIRRRLADELPVFAGGRVQPERKARSREDVVRRPPRSWDQKGGAGAKARGKSAKRSGTASRSAGATSKGSGATSKGSGATSKGAGTSSKTGGSGGRSGKKGRRAGGSGGRKKGR